jgi:FG-GAP-like repeat
LGQTPIWYLNNTTKTGSANGPGLPPGWLVLAVADFNGDSKPDYLLYNATTRQTAIWLLNNNVYIQGSAAYGPSVPVGWSLVTAADFNGDSIADFLLYNATTRQTAIWYINHARPDTPLGYAFGPTLPSN